MLLKAGCWLLTAASAACGSAAEFLPRPGAAAWVGPDWIVGSTAGSTASSTAVHDWSRRGPGTLAGEIDHDPYRDLSHA
jgi:hypothetical protein